MMSKHSLKVLCETLPGALFFFTYAFKLQMTWGDKLYTPLQTATAVLIAAAVAAAAASVPILKRWPWVPLLTAATAAFFGGLTLFFDDENFIKMKPTVVNTLFALGLWLSVQFKRPAAGLILGEAVPLTPADMRLFTLRWACFFAAMALINETVRRFGDTDAWVWWKTWGGLLCGVPFMLSQWPLLQRGLAAAQQAQIDRGSHE